jgi:protein-L-isoaspartate(D-aspartate) O-methyltransferase
MPAVAGVFAARHRCLVALRYAVVYRTLKFNLTLQTGVPPMVSAALSRDSGSLTGTHTIFDQLRTAMVESQLRVSKVTDEAVIRAMRHVPRELFVPVGSAARAYVDEAVAIAPGRFMMQPVVLGRLLSAASPRAGDTALVVGAGLCYTAAVLAEIGATVFAVESDAALAASAETNLVRAGYSHVTVAAADATEGLAAHAPYNLIVIDGAVDFIPDALSAQLAEGGVLVGVVTENGVGRGVLGRKGKDDFGFAPFMDAMIHSLPGFEKPKTFVF